MSYMAVSDAYLIIISTIGTYILIHTNKYIYIRAEIKELRKKHGLRVGHKQLYLVLVVAKVQTQIKWRAALL